MVAVIRRGRLSEHLLGLVPPYSMAILFGVVILLEVAENFVNILGICNRDSIESLQNFFSMRRMIVDEDHVVVSDEAECVHDCSDHFRLRSLQVGLGNEEETI